MKWISVREDTPEHCVTVAVLVRDVLHDGTDCDYLQAYTGYISFRDRWLLNQPDFDRRGATVDGNVVEYWCPLPKHKEFENE